MLWTTSIRSIAVIKIDWYVIDGTNLHRMQPNAPTRGDRAHHSFTQLTASGACAFRQLP